MKLTRVGAGRAALVACASVFLCACEMLAGIEERELAGETTCELGTAEHCGACGRACPGASLPGTRPVCSSDGPSGSCDIICLDEYYDVDGDADNGCEELDPDVHASRETATAVLLPDAEDPDNQSNPLNLIEYCFGDHRRHEPPPEERPFGRPDWWLITTEGEGMTDRGLGACLALSNHSPDARFEICISGAGATTMPTDHCAIAEGAKTSVCVHPPDDDIHEDGPFFVLVQQVAGSSSHFGYYLFLAH